MSPPDGHAIGGYGLLRHKTAQAAQAHWHATKECDQEIAERMSQMANEQCNVVPIEMAKKTNHGQKSSG